MERRRARRFVRRVDRAAGLRPEGRRSVAPARPEQRCSAEFRDAAAVPRLLAAPALRQEWQEPARPAFPDGSHRGSDLTAQHPAHPSAAAAPTARALQAAAGEAPRVPQALAAQPKAAEAARAEQDAAVGPQPAVALDAEVLRPVAAAARDAVAVVPRQVAEAAQALAALLPGAEAVRVSEVRRRAARDEAPGVRLSAAVSAAPLCLPEARLAPSASARSAHARESLRIAQP